MLSIKVFTFNPFQENTYLLFDENKKGIVFDPGMFDQNENQKFDSFVKERGIQLERLINTHCHLDHVFGNQHVYDTYNLAPEFHIGESGVYESASFTAKAYGLPHIETPKVKSYLTESDVVTIGSESGISMYTPGHSPASLSFFFPESKIIIAGDVLFSGSIGRTDLPGGNYDTLIHSIVENFLTLDDDVIVYPGHGPRTTIGREREANPFLQF